jgi:predicted oxidoreductase
MPNTPTSPFSPSPISLGLWRLLDWQLTTPQLQAFIEEALSLGVYTFDHADIYGDYSCEAAFGQLLKAQPGLREKMQLVSKCGIMLRSAKFPGRRVKHYDTSYAHIVESAEQSLRCLQTEYLDVLLIHRPDPLMDPAEVARAFEALQQAGKVRQFGVSNFSPGQYQMLNRHMGGRLVTNQVELSPFCLEHFQNGNMDFFLQEGIRPMAWSPLGGGRLMQQPDSGRTPLQHKLAEVATEAGLTDGMDTVAYAWILRHPSRPVPIVGSGKIERLRRAVEALQLQLNREQWFAILEAARGREVA